jgi:hypothetical protein
MSKNEKEKKTTSEKPVSLNPLNLKQAWRVYYRLSLSQKRSLRKSEGERRKRQKTKLKPMPRVVTSNTGRDGSSGREFSNAA